MNTFVCLLSVLINILSAEDNSDRFMQADLAFYKVYEGDYTLDERTSFYQSGEDRYISLVLCSGDRTVEYYEHFSERQKLWLVEKFVISVEFVIEADLPSCEYLTQVKVEGIRNGKVIYQRVDMFDREGRSIFPLLPPKPKADPPKEKEKKHKPSNDRALRRSDRIA